MVKGQMKIQQTAFMLLALTLFFAIVGMFVLGFQVGNLRDSATYLQEKNAVLLIEKLANSPEFSCEGAFGPEGSNCVDFDKAIFLKGRTEYNRFWGASNIEVRKIYPVEHEGVECTLSNYPNCGILTLGEEKEYGTFVSSFVSLCRKENSGGGIYDKCELALISASYEVK